MAKTGKISKEVLDVLGGDFGHVVGKGGGGGHHGGHHGGGGYGPRGWWGYDGPTYLIDDDEDDIAIIRPKVVSVVRPEILGSFDIQAEQNKFNALKPVTVSIAQALVRGGQDAMRQAQTIATLKSLPGGTARDNVVGHLKWHQDALAPLAGTPNAIYASSDDLKKWVMQAFIESNAVDEGANWLDSSWQRMWDDIKIAIAALPAQMRAAASAAISNITGIPTWAWAAGGVAVVGIALTAAYKILVGPLGQTAVGAYFGGRSRK